MLKDWEWERSLQCPLGFDWFDSTDTIICDMRSSPPPWQKTVWKDTISENSISNDTTLKKYTLRSFSQFKSTQKRGGIEERSSEGNFSFFLSLLSLLWNSAFRCLYLSFSPLVFAPFSSTLSETSVHWSSGTLSDLVPYIYFSLPVYNHTGFDLGHA